MSSYTIKSGDNLWNICKRQFGLTNSADIAKKVKEVAGYNNIKNANFIKAGQEIKLFNTDNQPASAAAERIKNSDIKTYDDLNKLAESKVSIFGENTKTDKQKQTAYLDYSEKLLSDYYDINKDGTVTVEEFEQVEHKGTSKTNELTQAFFAEQGGVISDSEKDQMATIAQRTANLFAKNLDMNADGIISKEEFAFFNENADEVDGAKDGIIKNAGETAMFKAVTGMNAGDKDINRVVNKYFNGETLTADEQKILEQSTVTIRKSMSKAAGFNVEG